MTSIKQILKALPTAALIVALSACSAGQATTQPSAGAPAASSSGATAAATAVPTPAASVAEALAGKDEIKDAAAAAPASGGETTITLSGDSITAGGAGVTVDGAQATITAAGTYRLSGTLADGRIVVDTADKEPVRLILDGAALSSSTSSPLAIMQAATVEITLAEGSENSVADAAAYVYAAPDVDEPNAAIFSAADLTIDGAGALTVSGNANDGIASKDGLLISGGTITVTAADDGIRGKDYLAVRGGTITVTAKGDGLKSDNAEDPARGYVAIEGGSLAVTAGGDALSAETDALIADGTLHLTAGGGADGSLAADASAKGVKAASNVTIDGGALTIDAADDAIHSNANVTINNGTLALASGDDGVHADAALTINGGATTISQSYEGIESAVITINGGSVHLVAEDDGVNVAGGADGSGMQRPGGRGRDTGAYAGSFFLRINGGEVVVDAGGDGLDANGAIEMTGGLVLVSGPTAQMNAALDYDGGFAISGGTLVAAGSAGMAQAPGANSSQRSVQINFTATQPAGSLVQIQAADGANLMTFAPAKDFQTLVFSSPALAAGDYQILVGGSPAGAAVGGWYEGGAASAGAAYATFSASEIVTQVGTAQGRMRR
ncbi:MAG TPA: carbohydrate-binding domain-containing protein [Herpetosiphonaceae bacterium]